MVFVVLHFVGSHMTAARVGCMTSCRICHPSAPHVGGKSQAVIDGGSAPRGRRPLG